MQGPRTRISAVRFLSVILIQLGTKFMVFTIARGVCRLVQVKFSLVVIRLLLGWGGRGDRIPIWVSSEEMKPLMKGCKPASH